MNMFTLIFRYLSTDRQTIIEINSQQLPESQYPPILPHVGTIILYKGRKYVVRNIDEGMIENPTEMYNPTTIVVTCVLLPEMK
jgi:hypothetical protein